MNYILNSYWLCVSVQISVDLCVTEKNEELTQRDTEEMNYYYLFINAFNGFINLNINLLLSVIISAVPVISLIKFNSIL